MEKTLELVNKIICPIHTTKFKQNAIKIFLNKNAKTDAIKISESKAHS